MLSNSLIACAGRGDTIWVVNSEGVNYTVARGDTLSWEGFRTYDLQWDGPSASIAFGGGIAAVPRKPRTDNDIVNDLWVFDYRTGTASIVAPGWNARVNNARGYYFVVGAAWTPSAFWLACENGGVVRWDPVAKTKTVYYPDTATSWNITDFPTQRLANLDDTARAVLGVVPSIDSAGDTIVYVLCEQRVRVLHPATKTWDTLSNAIDTTGIMSSFTGLYARTDAHSPLFATIIKLKSDTGTASDTFLCRYDPARTRWKALRTGVTALTFGKGDTLYLASGNQVLAYQATDSGFIKNALLSASFTLRSENNGAFGAISDILFVPHTGDADGNLWIASSDTGLFFSHHELQDEITNTIVVWSFRSPRLRPGLKDSYFYPSILFGESPHSICAYNLDKDANVTISIYDWNMDFVTTIIDKQPRLAGKKQRTGRSTVPEKDFWDGANGRGRGVAAGVYYYKIIVSTGEHSFGKIIVAR
jgi:hypothetical protein